MLNNAFPSVSGGSNLLRTTGGRIVTRMHRTAVSYAAAFRVSRGTAAETGPVVMGALQELHTLLRRARARSRQRRTADHRGNHVIHVVIVAVHATLAISQKRVQVVVLGVGDGRQVVNTGRCPGRVDAGGTRRAGILVVLAAATPGILVVLSAVELSQVRLLMAPGGPASARPPPLRAEHRRASSPRQARHASSSRDERRTRRATTSGTDENGGR